MHISVKIEQNSIDEFIDHWSGKYHYAHEHKYDTNIAKDLTQDKNALMKMFKWKNGRKLSSAKRNSVCEKTIAGAVAPLACYWQVCIHSSPANPIEMQAGCQKPGLMPLVSAGYPDCPPLQPGSVRIIDWQLPIQKQFQVVEHL